MRLFDTNVIVYACDPDSPFHAWAVEAIADAAGEGGPGACINAATLAELCAQPGVNETLVAGEIMAFGIAIVEIPASCADVCGAAYRQYVARRKAESGKDSPKMPLPDFFIGAHAQTAQMDLVTNDVERIRAYFPRVRCITPARTPAPPASPRSAGSN
ncbi:MAG: type II toxin-antitoxin system VapC family toxin [Limisphaerales bacterium]